MVLSKGQKLLEIARCIKDPIYGIETYLHTEDRTQGGEVPFKLFPRQKELVNGYVNHKHNIVMKPRQAGISTTTAAYLAILSALSNPENKQRILIAANKQETAKEFLKKIRDFTRQLPAWMDIYRPASSSDWFMKEKNSDSHYRLNNGSEVKAVASSKDALRGYTPSIIVIDEAAFIEGGRGEEFYEAAQPSLSTGGRSILISCVTDDTFVLTPDGIKEVSDFIDYTKDGGYNTNEYEVYGYGGSRKSNILYNNGFVDTKIIETKYSKLEGSNNHKLYAFSNKDNKFGWYKLEDLSIGDFVSIHYNNNVWGDRVIELNECKMLGVSFNYVETLQLKNFFDCSRSTIHQILKSYFNNNELFIKTKKKVKVINHDLLKQLRFLLMNLGVLSEIKDDNTLIFKGIHLKILHTILRDDETQDLKEKTQWVKIKSITNSKNNTYDFSLPNNDSDFWCHSVLYNGILGHQTPNGYDVLYHKTYKMAKLGKNNFNIVEMKWYEDPRYNKGLSWLLLDEKSGETLETKTDPVPEEEWPKLILDGWVPTSPWYENMCAQLNHNPRSIAQELNCVTGDMYVTVRDKITKEIIKSKIEDLYGLLGGVTVLGFTLNERLEILSYGGFEDFIGLRRKISRNVFEIKLSNGVILKSTKNHKYPSQDCFIKTKNLKKGDKLKTYNGVIVTVVDVIKIKHGDYVYDPVNVGGGNLYYINDILTHNCDFLGSGNGVIDDKYVKRQERDNVRQPIRKEWVDGNMWIWCDPIKDHQYILAADASSGSSDDWAVICIMDYTTGEQVAEYQGKVAPDVLGEIANYYGQSYDAFIVVDITGGWGASTVLKLIDLGYPKTKMFYDVTVGIDSVENNRALQKHMDNGKLPGLNFQKNRNVIISELEKGIRMDSFKVRSMRSIAEMDTFVYINGRPDHMKNYHDDCLMSIGMCLFVAMTSFKDLEKSKGQAKAMVESWVITSTSTENVNTLSRSVDFFMANNDVNHVQQADSQHNWVFGGLPGFKKKKPR